MSHTPFRVVVMGVSGCGKSTVGHLLAGRMGVPFVEGDDLHSPANVAKMAAGHPLTDEDRAGWLQALSERLRQSVQNAQGLVVACSALKKPTVMCCAKVPRMCFLCICRAARKYSRSACANALPTTCPRLCCKASWPYWSRHKALKWP